MKKIANELAKMIMSNGIDSIEVQNKIKQLNPLTSKDSVNLPNDKVNLPKGKIGIWERKEIDGKTVYERGIQHSSEWRMWANNHRIPANKSKKRVAFLGESVARGYFFDPCYTPAMELEAQLQGLLKTEEVEVIDLAKNSMGLEELAEISTSCLDLNPDVIIVFAGNNWCKKLHEPFMFDKDDVKRMKRAVREASYTELKEIMEEKMKALLESFIQHLSDLSKKNNTPVIVMIPEFNLLDWSSSPLEKIVTKLPNDGTERWIEARDRAEQYIELGDWENATSQAQLMTEIDVTNPLGYELLAQGKIHYKAYDEARELLELGRDAAIFSRAGYTPRNLRINRDTILDCAEKHGLHVIDLTEVFKEHLNGKIPGRDFFLDYCHLTLEGIKISMKHTASKVTELISEKSTNPNGYQTISPKSEVVAMANIFAAVHNSRYGQNAEIIKYLCKEGVKEPKIAKHFMLLYASLATRKISTELTSNYEQIVAEELGNQYGKGTGLLHPPNRKLFDLDLVNGMIEALETIGVSIDQPVQLLRIREHGVGANETNLLESFYSKFSTHELFVDKKAFYEAHNSFSDFILISDQEAPLQLIITYRTTNSNHDIEVLINGQNLATFESGKAWQTHKMIIPLEFQKSGINKLTVKWATDLELEFGENGFESPTSLDDIYTSLYPIFGEIHTLKVSKCD